MMWQIEEKVLAACVAALGVLVLVLVWLLVADTARHWGHPGHRERIRVEGQTVVQPIITSGNGSMQSGMTTQYVPEHEESVWVCDRCK